MANGANGLEPSRLHASDALRTATVGLRTRKLRAALSALGIMIGIAAMVGVSRDRLLHDYIIPMMRYLTATHRTGDRTTGDVTARSNAKISVSTRP
mgnify:CR=1 FL=1